MKMPIRQVRAKIPVFTFKERDTFVAYCPILDLSSCGHSVKDAQKRFAGAVSLFLEELDEMGTLDQVLMELGWRKHERPRREWIPPQPVKRTQLGIQIPLPAA